MEKQLQINAVKRKLGTLMSILGFKYIKEAQNEFQRTKFHINQIQQFFNTNGITLPVNNLDVDYFTTSWDNWQKILDTIYPILQEFKWTRETGDCDNRANFMTTTAGILFDVNTCTEIYCHVSNATTGKAIDYHKANIIIDDAGNTYLFDADNGGLRQKITGLNHIMGNWRYQILGIRAY
jgi:hypothetical protein